MPQLKLEFEDRKPKNAAALFITKFYTFFRDYGMIETDTSVVLYHGEQTEKRDAYWEQVYEQINALLAICDKTDFESFGKSMVYGFADALEKQNTRYVRMVKEQQKAIEREKKRREREKREGSINNS